MTRFPVRSLTFRVPQAKSETFAVNGPGSRVVVVFIQNRNVVGRLPSQNGLFRLTIMVQVRMPVEVIRSEIGDDGHMGTHLQTIEIGQLKAAQFEHDKIVWLNLIDHRQQACSDVSPQPGASP